jgi:hypothetical protein
MLNDMIRFLPINTHDTNNRSAKINFHLTKGIQRNEKETVKRCRSRMPFRLSRPASSTLWVPRTNQTFILPATINSIFRVQHVRHFVLLHSHSLDDIMGFALTRFNLRSCLEEMPNSRINLHNTSVLSHKLA